eukprot:CAMPEP_0170197180 /NCGR_PEP_ID=MMETSP0040_2-20121228/65750_1 /TAXON_ID=641309 /ORGANISM="Lotharella oceanica, Strain CCMP622" /LENGTH=98 /DNA_ID=CAMNT_0010446803 /DNA_START=238 /DNA_END=531 /DNA_ORIENTATION=-
MFGRKKQIILAPTMHADANKLHRCLKIISSPTAARTTPPSPAIAEGNQNELIAEVELRHLFLRTSLIGVEHPGFLAEGLLDLAFRGPSANLHELAAVT